MPVLPFLPPSVFENLFGFDGKPLSNEEFTHRLQLANQQNVTATGQLLAQERARQEYQRHLQVINDEQRLYLQRQQLQMNRALQFDPGLTPSTPEYKPSEFYSYHSQMEKVRSEVVKGPFPFDWRLTLALSLIGWFLGKVIGGFVF